MCDKCLKQLGKVTISAVILQLVLATFLISAYAESRDYSKAVIHHTASHDVSAKTIDKWHREERGWDSIGYHFVIRKNGLIEKGRELWKKGAHKKGHNQKTGIVLTGYDEFTKKQLTSLKKLLKKLKIKDVERHHEECPGKGIKL